MILPFASAHSIQIEIPGDDSRPNRIYVVSRFLRTLGALWASEVVLFNSCQFFFVLHQPQNRPAGPTCEEIGGDFGNTLGLVSLAVVPCSIQDGLEYVRQFHCHHAPRASVCSPSRVRAASGSAVWPVPRMNREGGRTAPPLTGLWWDGISQQQSTANRGRKRTCEPEGQLRYYKTSVHGR